MSDAWFVLCVSIFSTFKSLCIYAYTGVCVYVCTWQSWISYSLFSWRVSQQTEEWVGGPAGHKSSLVKQGCGFPDCYTGLALTYTIPQPVAPALATTLRLKFPHLLLPVLICFLLSLLFRHLLNVYCPKKLERVGWSVHTLGDWI